MEEFDEEFEKTLEEIDSSNVKKKNSKKSSASYKKKDDEDVIETSFLETENEIVEQINNINPISNNITTLTTHTTPKADNCFLIFNKQTGSTTTSDKFIHNNKVYCPIVDELLKEGGITLPSGVEEYGTTEELVEELKIFFNKYFQVPDFYEVFLPYLCLFYWVYERFPFVPYTHFVGRTATGKSTAMEVFGSVCYKPIDASGSITMASIFRIVTKWKGTLLLDEFDGAGENYREMMSFLKSGVSNKVVLRTEGEGKKEVKAFIVKSPKIFTSENPISNAGLQSRTIVIRMEKNKRRVPLYRLKPFEEESKLLRNKLLLWRLRTMGTIDLTSIEYGFEALQGLDARVQQVITPIYYMCGEEAKKDIIKFAEEQQDETFRERREAIDGQIFQFIYDHYNDLIREITISKITDSLNAGKNNKFDNVSAKRVANTIRKVLGFDIQRLGDENISTVMFDDGEEKMKELYAYYGLSPLSLQRVDGVGSVVNDDIVSDAEELFNS